MPRPGRGGRRPMNAAVVRPVERTNPESDRPAPDGPAQGKGQDSPSAGKGETFPSAPSPTTGQQARRGLHKSLDGEAEGFV